MGILYGILQSRFKSAKRRKVRALRFVGAVEDDYHSSFSVRDAIYMEQDLTGFFGISYLFYIYQSNSLY